MYYPLDGVPEFWDWIDHQATNGRIKLPLEVLEEVLAGSRKQDPLLDWMNAHRDVLRLNEQVDPSLVNKVVTDGYAPDLTDDELKLAKEKLIEITMVVISAAVMALVVILAAIMVMAVILAVVWALTID